MSTSDSLLCEKHELHEEVAKPDLPLPFIFYRVSHHIKIGFNEFQRCCSHMMFKGAKLTKKVQKTVSVNVA